MEKLKNKHNHALTQWLKVIIFAILMLAPFMSIGARCLYVINNKNAKDSYSGETTYEINYKYQSNEVNSVSDLVEGHTYLFTFNTVLGSNNNASRLLLNDDNVIDIKKYTLTYSNAQNYYYRIIEEDLFNIDYFEFYEDIPYEETPIDYQLISTDNVNDDTFFNAFVYVENTNLAYNLTTSIVFTLVEINDLNYFTNNISNISEYNEIESVNIDNTGTLDNAFEYSVNHLADEQWIAWTKNTGIYTPINAMTSGLGFDAQTNVLAILLTYWSLLTAVYIVFDIIIVCFTKITHLISGND